MPDGRAELAFTGVSEEEVSLTDVDVGPLGEIGHKGDAETAPSNVAKFEGVCPANEVTSRLGEEAVHSTVWLHSVYFVNSVWVETVVVVTEHSIIGGLLHGCGNGKGGVTLGVPRYRPQYGHRQGLQ